MTRDLEEEEKREKAPRLIRFGARLAQHQRAARRSAARADWVGFGVWCRAKLPDGIHAEHDAVGVGEHLRFCRHCRERPELDVGEVSVGEWILETTHCSQAQ